MNTSFMKQWTRLQRLIIGFIFPPLTGAFLFVLEDPKSALSFINTADILLYTLVIFFVFSYAGIQSLAYSCLMEFLVNPYIKNNLLAILTSVLIGSLSGYLIEAPSFQTIIELTSKGAITGLIVGALLRWSYIKASKDELVKQSTE